MKLKKVAKNHGLTPKGVDYALTQYQIVIDEITHGTMSKLSYDANDIIRVAQEHWCDTCDLKEREEETEIKQIWSSDYHVHVEACECGAIQIPAYFTHSNYCSGCGKAVKQDD